MATKAFIVVCKCGVVIGAYDPARSDVKLIGQAVRQADERGYDIRFASTPLVIGGCTCPVDNPDWKEGARELLLNGNQWVLAIQYHRKITGASLKTARAEVEELRRELGMAEMRSSE